METPPGEQGIQAPHGTLSPPLPSPGPALGRQLSQCPALKISGAHLQESQRAGGNRDSAFKGLAHKLTPKPSTEAVDSKVPGPYVKDISS